MSHLNVADPTSFSTYVGVGVEEGGATVLRHCRLVGLGDVHTVAAHTLLSTLFDLEFSKQSRWENHMEIDFPPK